MKKEGHKVLNELALFAGAGGGILGGLLHGWRTVAAVEIEDYPRRILLQRQADGILPRFPIWDDVCTFDGHPWRGKVDVVTGGFPCQDISAAGKGAGIEGERSGLWSEMARIISEVRPRFAFMENSPLLVSRGLTTVLSDLAEMGYDARWCVIGANDLDAPHIRKRIWILANRISLQVGVSDTMCNGVRELGERNREQCREPRTPQPQYNGEAEHVAYTQVPNVQVATKKQTGYGFRGIQTQSRRSCGRWWKTEPNVGRVADGVADFLDRLKATGNGQVPIVAATAWKILTDGHM